MLEGFDFIRAVAERFGDKHEREMDNGKPEETPRDGFTEVGELETIDWIVDDSCVPPVLVGRAKDGVVRQEFGHEHANGGEHRPTTVDEFSGAVALDVALRAEG